MIPYSIQRWNFKLCDFFHPNEYHHCILVFHCNSSPRGQSKHCSFLFLFFYSSISLSLFFSFFLFFLSPLIIDLNLTHWEHQMAEAACRGVYGAYSTCKDVSCNFIYFLTKTKSSNFCLLSWFWSKAIYLLYDLVT